MAEVVWHTQTGPVMCLLILQRCCARHIPDENWPMRLPLKEWGEWPLSDLNLSPTEGVTPVYVREQIANLPGGCAPTSIGARRRRSL